ncbi:MAG: serine hydrolase, partial [Planctomycetota bacterium]|nr:serine hydrolase [Planctomycetota bacterium]
NSKRSSGKARRPCHGAAVIVGGRLLAFDAVGVRKRGAAIVVTKDVHFHLGSCTKAVTATLIARLSQSR